MGRWRLEDHDLRKVRELREMGASLIKLDADGSITLAFDRPYEAAAALEEALKPPAESDALFDSADD